MSWAKVNHNGNRLFEECSSCEHLFYKGEVCYKKSWVIPCGMIMGFQDHKTLTEIVCSSCLGKRKLKVGRDRTKKK